MTTEEKLAKLVQDFAELKAKLVGAEARNEAIEARVKQLEPKAPFVSN